MFTGPHSKRGESQKHLRTQLNATAKYKIYKIAYWTALGSRLSREVRSPGRLQHLCRKPKMSPHSPLRNPKTNPHSLAATMTNSNSLTTTLRRTPTPSPQPQGYEVTELESRCEQKIFAKWEVGLETLLFESAARFGTQQTKREHIRRPWRRD